MERSGGVAGLKVRHRLATDELDEQSRSALGVLVEAAEAAGPALATGEAPRRADGFHYQLTIERDGETVTHDVEEPGAAPELLELVHWVRTHGRRG